MGTIYKAYVIIHDGTQVLVGIGGKVKGSVRQGYHLPGGTYTSGTPEDAAKRECKEETGIVLPSAPTLVTGYPKTYPGGTNTTYSVSVFTVKVSTEVLAQYKSSTLPAAGNGTDDPFTGLLTPNISTAKLDTANFKPAFYTDWFLDALKAAL